MYMSALPLLALYTQLRLFTIPYIHFIGTVLWDAFWVTSIFSNPWNNLEEGRNVEVSVE
jgi:hypothetical protein